MPVAGLIASSVGSVIGGIQSRNAVQNAAQTQIKMSKEAQALEQKNQQAGIDFQTGEWTGQQANEQPFLQLGQTSANNLRNIASNSFPGSYACSSPADSGVSVQFAAGNASNRTECGSHREPAVRKYWGRAAKVRSRTGNNDLSAGLPERSESVHGELPDQSRRGKCRPDFRRTTWKPRSNGCQQSERICISPAERSRRSS